ncbi:MAG: STAUR_1299 family protein [Myxococcaceae bacterium]
MSQLIADLSSMAFHRGDVTRANEEIDGVRASRGDDGRDALSYEIALPALGPEDYLSHKALPKLVYFLDCRGVKPPASGDVFVTLFSLTPQPELLFVDAGPFVERVAKERGLSCEDAVARYGEKGSGDPLLLGGT